MANKYAIHEDFERREAVRSARDRSFGIVFAVLFVLIGLWPLWAGDSVHAWSLVVAGAFLLLAGLRPALLHPLNRAWMALGRGLHAIASPLVLGLIFYLVVWPTALVARLAGKDSLRLGFDPETKSYWIPRHPRGPDPQTMRNQF
jgi:hypothetical protein